MLVSNYEHQEDYGLQVSIMFFCHTLLNTLTCSGELIAMVVPALQMYFLTWQ